MSTIDKIVEEAVEGAKGPFIVSDVTESNMRDAARRAAIAAVKRCAEIIRDLRHGVIAADEAIAAIHAEFQEATDD